MFSAGRLNRSSSNQNTPKFDSFCNKLQLKVEYLSFRIILSVFCRKVKKSVVKWAKSGDYVLIEASNPIFGCFFSDDDGTTTNCIGSFSRLELSLNRTRHDTGQVLYEITKRTFVLNLINYFKVKVRCSNFQMFYRFTHFCRQLVKIVIKL